MLQTVKTDILLFGVTSPERFGRYILLKIKIKNLISESETAEMAKYEQIRKEEEAIRRAEEERIAAEQAAGRR